MVCNFDVKLWIMDQYVDWKGVCYCLGGSIKKGVDCFSFVQCIFCEQFGLEFLCLIYEQQEMGKVVLCNNLCMGDLVLFCVGFIGCYVGIYIGNNQFVYVFISSGVIIFSMNELYWKKCYNEVC